MGLMMMSKMNSTLPDNSFIDSSIIRLNRRDYSMRKNKVGIQLAGSRGIFRFISFARSLSQRHRGDRKSVQVAPEQLDEARFTEFDLTAREDARPSEGRRRG